MQVIFFLNIYHFKADHIKMIQKLSKNHFYNGPDFFFFFSCGFKVEDFAFVFWFRKERFAFFWVPFSQLKKIISHPTAVQLLLIISESLMNYKVVLPS